MKGFMVVDRLNDIRFIDTDKEFARHINEQARENGLPIDNDIYTLDPNIVMQQFSPLIMSQWFMIDHCHNPCTSITCENNFLFVFKQFEDFLIIAINGDGMETEDFLRRKTLVFIRLTGFLLGPVVDEIGNPKFTSKKERWRELRLVLSMWTYLANNEQSFLVEAVEKLHVNQMVNEQCTDMLQSVVAKLQESGERSTQHALLLVNSKLLSLYSSQNAQELQSSDILCISLLVRSLFPTNDRLEDLFAYTSKTSDTNISEARSPATVKLAAPHRDRERYESAAEGFTTGDETENDEYFSAWDDGRSGDNASGSSKEDRVVPTPVTGTIEQETDSQYPEVSESFYTPTTSPTRHSSKGSPTSPTRHSSKGSPKSDKTRGIFSSTWPDMKRSRSHTYGELEGHEGVSGTSEMEDTIGRGRSRSLNESRRKDPILCGERNSPVGSLPLQESATTKTDDEVKGEADTEEEDFGYVRQAVFLMTNICKYLPFQMHCIKIFPGIVLIYLTEMPKQSQSPRLVLLMNLFRDLINGHQDVTMRAQGQTIYDWINRQITILLQSMKKSKGPLANLCHDLKMKWESEELMRGITTYFEKGTATDMPQTLERSLRYLQTKVTEIFKYLYLYPRPLTQALHDVVATVTSFASKQLDDYRHYLTVKAQRNIVMTTYIDDFPGLIHFIYVNRQTNRMVAPALNITNTEDNTKQDATQLLKDKIWAMSSWMQQKLHQGYTCITTHEGDYHYSYFIWFENCKGEPEVIQKPFKGDCTAPPPGILTGNFYKYLTHKCFPDAVPNAIHCNELMMMHVGLANSHYIAMHCRQLAAKLYETSGTLLSSVPML